MTTISFVTELNKMVSRVEELEKELQLERSSNHEVLQVTNETIDRLQESLEKTYAELRAVRAQLRLYEEDRMVWEKTQEIRRLKREVAAEKARADRLLDTANIFGLTTAEFASDREAWARDIKRCNTLYHTNQDLRKECIMVKQKYEKLKRRVKEIEGTSEGSACKRARV